MLWVGFKLPMSVPQDQGASRDHRAADVEIFWEYKTQIFFAGLISCNSEILDIVSGEERIVAQVDRVPPVCWDRGLWTPGAER